jgi:peptidoglycan L-alanyl-D-glutamate endopeptidase CwlK
MPNFSAESEAILCTCDCRLVEIMRTVIQFFDIKVLHGYRDEVSQNKAYASGNSKLKYPNSKHNTKPSLAIDIAPYPVNFNHPNDFIYLAGHVMMTAHLLGYNIRWGYDWNGNNSTADERFADMGHFEIVG